jgi:lysophospholipase L1-like esterase
LSFWSEGIKSRQFSDLHLLKVHFKLLPLLFFSGMILGIITSPLKTAEPKDFILSPISNINAQESQVADNTNSVDKNTIALYFQKFDQQQEITKYQKVLGAQAEKNHASNNNSMAENSESISNKTGNFTIAIFGDSMVDTMGTGLPYLDNFLKNYYPQSSFKLLNYGIGAENVVAAQQRFGGSFSYKDRNYPSVLSSNADIFIIGSFAYNPIDNTDEYENSLRNILSQFLTTGKKVYFLATIAPLKSQFGVGPGGINWPPDTAWTHATKIQEHMERGIKVAQSLGVPVIDCYHATLNANGEGVATHVNSHDGIHPSISGHNYIAGQIAGFIQI